MKTTRTIYNRSAKAIKTTASKPSKVTTLTSLNEEMTLRELLTLVSPTAGVSLPTAKALRESSTPAAVYAVPDFSMIVYKNGFVVAQNTKRLTVIRLDYCKGYHLPSMRSLQKGTIMENMIIAQNTATVNLLPEITAQTTLGEILSILGMELGQKREEKTPKRKTLLETGGNAIVDLCGIKATPHNCKSMKNMV